MPELAIVDFPLSFIADHLNTAGSRAEGYHLTSLIRASRLIAKNKPLDPADFWYSNDPEARARARAEDFDEMAIGMMSMGRVWEEASRSAFKARVEKLGLYADLPSQKEFDGVVVNIDGSIWSTNPMLMVAVQESKFRFSRPSDPRDNDDWMSQTKGYCKAFGCLSVWMPVCNIQTRPPMAESRIYAINFTQAEVDENWQMITKTRAYLERISKSENKSKGR